MASRAASKGVSFIKRGGHEIPEIRCCIGMIGFSAVLLAAGFARCDKDKDHQEKFTYTVVRTEEVREEWAKKKVYN